jgi:hypothetical protein
MARIPARSVKRSSRGGRRKTVLPADLEKLVRQSLPEGLVERQSSPDESWFAEVEKKVRSRLGRLAGSALAFERPPEPELPPDDASDEPPEDRGERERSYHLFFVAPKKPWAHFEVEYEMPAESEGDDEDDVSEGWEERLVKVRGTEQVGCAVGVSLIAPVGLVRLTSMTTYVDRPRDEPDIEPTVFDLDFKPMDPHAYWAELFAGKQLSEILDLERRATEALTSLGIRVLAAEEAALAVPHLRAGEACIAEPVRLVDAFFFEVP